MTRAKDPWAAFRRAAYKHQEAALRRVLILTEIRDAIRGGVGVELAIIDASVRHDVSRSTLQCWRRLVRGVAPELWMAHLVPKYKGGGRKADCSPDAWAAWLAGLRRERGITLAENYRRLRSRGCGVWAIPSKRTLVRRTLEQAPELLGRPPVVPTDDDRNAAVVRSLRALADALESGAAG